MAGPGSVNLGIPGFGSVLSLYFNTVKFPVVVVQPGTGTTVLLTSAPAPASASPLMIAFVFRINEACALAAVRTTSAQRPARANMNGLFAIKGISSIAHARVEF